MQRKRRHVEGNVELNVAAMLDMAFQLLAFFILTYHPAPVEGCIAIRMPLPTPMTKPDSSSNAGAPTPSEANALAGAVTLQIAVTSNKDGTMATIRLGENPPVTELADFERQFRSMSDISFEQVVLQVSPILEYENVLKVIEICARNKLTAGDRQAKVSIVEMP
jgi:biopolymer transport protein ExbD